MSARVAASRLVWLLVACSACCHGTVGIFMSQGPGVDLASLSYIVATARGPESFDRLFLPPPGGFKENDALMYKGTVKEGDWTLALAGYEKGRLVAFGMSQVTIARPCIFLQSGYSDVDVVTTVVLTSDATH